MKIERLKTKNILCAAVAALSFCAEINATDKIGSNSNTGHPYTTKNAITGVPIYSSPHSKTFISHVRNSQSPTLKPENIQKQLKRMSQEQNSASQPSMPQEQNLAFQLSAKTPPQELKPVLQLATSKQLSAVPKIGKLKHGLSHQKATDYVEYYEAATNGIPPNTLVDKNLLQKEMSKITPLADDALVASNRLLLTKEKTKFSDSLRSTVEMDKLSNLISDFKQNCARLKRTHPNSNRRLTAEEFLSIDNPSQTYTHLKNILKKTNDLVVFFEDLAKPSSMDPKFSSIKTTFYIALIRTGMDIKEFAFELLANNQSFPTSEILKELNSRELSSIAGMINNLASSINMRNAWHRHVRESAISKELDDLTTTDIEITNVVNTCNTYVDLLNKKMNDFFLKTKDSSFSENDFNELTTLQTKTKAFIDLLSSNLKVSWDGDFDKTWKMAADETQTYVNTLVTKARIHDDSKPLIAGDVDISGSERQMLSLAKSEKQKLIEALKITLNNFAICLNNMITLFTANSDLFKTKEEAIKNFQSLYRNVGYVTCFLIGQYDAKADHDVAELITARQTIYQFLRNKATELKGDALFKTKIDLHLALPAELTEMNNKTYDAPIMPYHHALSDDGSASEPSPQAKAYLNKQPYPSNSAEKACAYDSTWWPQKNS